MPWLDVFWNAQIEAHIGQHGFDYADVENALSNPVGGDVSHSSGKPIRFGLAIDGRKMVVVFEMIDSVTVYPITAYEVK